MDFDGGDEDLGGGEGGEYNEYADLAAETVRATSLAAAKDIYTVLARCRPNKRERERQRVPV